MTWNENVVNGNFLAKKIATFVQLTPLNVKFQNMTFDSHSNGFTADKY